MGRNKDSLLRAVDESALANATRGGSCAHPDQSRGLARWRNLRAISGVGASSSILLFFLGGGVALHERLVGTFERHEKIAHVDDRLDLYTKRTQLHTAAHKQISYRAHHHIDRPLFESP
jgi:hypothetical protein